jgi:serine/threonine-protein kinase
MPVPTNILYCPSCNNPISPGTRFCATCGNQLQAQAGQAGDPLIGQFVGGRFLVQAKLGEGGMGAVYQAEQVAMKRPIALKVLHPHLSQDPQLIERFHREAAASSRLNHPNTITVHDFGQTDDGTLYIAMEFVEGRNMGDLVEQGGAMAWPRVVGIGLQIAESLADAHAAGIVHRDLKPDNVMLIDRAGQNDFVKILDFGIAKMAEASEGGDKRKALTKTGMIFGTPQYMSPEQIRGAGVDHRTDIYALGVILYQILTGSLPFHAENPMGMLTKHLMEPPRPLAQALPGISCPPQLEALVMRCLEKDQNQRFQSMNEIVQVLSSLANETRPGFAVYTPAPVAGAAGALVTGQNRVPSYPGQQANTALPQSHGDPFARSGTGGFAASPPSGGFAANPSGGFAANPSGGFAANPSGGYVTTPPSGGFVANPSGGYATSPPSGGFAAQYSGGGVTPAPVGATGGSGAGRKIGVAVAVVVLLGGLGVGGAFAWKAISDDGDQPTTTAPNTTVASTVPPNTVPPSTVPPNTVPPSTVPPSTIPPFTIPPNTVPPSTMPPSTVPPLTNPPTAPSKTARCSVEASGKNQESEQLATSLASRADQLSLCFAPLLSKTFDGGVRVAYKFGHGKGPNDFEAAKNTFGSDQVVLCLKTAIQMASHPESKTSRTAQVFVKASGGGGKLNDCKIAASVPVRSKGKGPKPTWWNSSQPNYPDYGGGYGGGY